MIPVSYPLQKDTPLYPGTVGLSITPFKSISNGDSSNSSIFSFCSHSTTHVDVPRHFCQEGSSVSDLLHAEMVYFPSYCLDIPKENDECIEADDFKTVPERKSDAKALLIKTGFARYRDVSRDRYINRHPWVHPDLPRFLREHFPRLELIGFDILSVSVPAHRQEGRQCHRAFLCDAPPVFIIEDADLSDPRLLKERLSLRIYPWILEAIDGVPVSAFAEEE